MITYKSKEEIELLRQGGKILHQILHQTADLVRPGVSTWELDQYAEQAILKAGGIPAFKHYGRPPYPATLCTSVNDEVVHGIPTKDRILQNGDIISLDIGMRYPAAGGLYTDMAITVSVGEIDKKTEKLIEVTRKSLEMIADNIGLGVDWQYVAGKIQRYIEAHGFGIVRSLVGHGVGHEVHEDPQLPNYVINDYHLILKPGMVLAFEPMVTMGNYNVKTLDDEWTVSTTDGSFAAHFEHTMAITEQGVIVITKA